MNTWILNGHCPCPLVSLPLPNKRCSVTCCLLVCYLTTSNQIIVKASTYIYAKVHIPVADDAKGRRSMVPLQKENTTVELWLATGKMLCSGCRCATPIKICIKTSKVLYMTRRSYLRPTIHGRRTISSRIRAVQSALPPICFAEITWIYFHTFLYCMKCAVGIYGRAKKRDVFDNKIMCRAKNT